MGVISLTTLPDEIVQHVLFSALPQDALAFRLVSKRMNSLASEPLLWKHHCVTSFKYWAPEHQIRRKLLANVTDIDWKRIFLYRQDVASRTTRTLDSILSSQIERIGKFAEISKFGYDAKDALLQQCATRDAEEDVLSRRFYANTALDHLHRGIALEQWWRLSRGDSIALDRALGAFDLFVLHDRPGDLHEISDLLDALVDQIRTEHPNIDEWPRRQRAVAIARYLRAYNYTGIPTELHYRDLQNNYIGIALQDPDHPSSPSISVAIYCCVARRLGLYAYSCGFPNHPHAVVKLDPGGVPDGTHGDEGPGEVPLLYLDPYRTDAEIPIEHLRSQLAAWGVNPVQFQRFLGESSTRNIVLRTSRNILATVHEFRGLGGGAQNTGHPTIRLYGNPFADLDDAFYSALWANFMLCSPPAQPDPTEQAQFLPMILERFERLYPMDANLIERYVYPAFRSAAPPDQFGLPETLRVVRTTDSMPKQVRSRGPPGSLGDVKYFVGQVFQHKRYGYTAVIIGWDVECSMNPQWMARNQIDRLSQGRNQSFYHALVEDTTTRYVAEENVSIIEPTVPTSLMGLAGRYFKRWDHETKRFVSNVKDEYPDD